jgi:hypothetical protein
MFISSRLQPCVGRSRRQLEEVCLLFSRKYTLTLTEDMHKRLEEERRRRFLHSIPETIRMIVSEYLSHSNTA